MLKKQQKICWLPTEQGIKYKSAHLCYKTVVQPLGIHLNLISSIFPKDLCSASDNHTWRKPTFKRKCWQWAFSYIVAKSPTVVFIITVEDLLSVQAFSWNKDTNYYRMSLVEHKSMWRESSSFLKWPSSTSAKTFSQTKEWGKTVQKIKMINYTPMNTAAFWKCHRHIHSLFTHLLKVSHAKIDTHFNIKQTFFCSHFKYTLF